MTRDDACSTPEGVIVSITAEGCKSDRASLAAQRPEASSSRSHRSPDILGPVVHLLNARRRHRLDHDAILYDALWSIVCSTPGGVIVSITSASAPRPCWLPSAQRPEASSSRSPSALQEAQAIADCSTPGGVIVSITVHRIDGRVAEHAAQRPEASSSRSRRRPWRARPAASSSAQRPEASSSRSPRRHGPRGTKEPSCSTPGGVIVSITTPSIRTSGNRPSAQRPEASSSRSPGVDGKGRGIDTAAQRPEASSSRSQFGHDRDVPPAGSCSTPGGVIVSITPGGGRLRRGPSSAQRPEASSSRSPDSTGSGSPRLETAQRPEASSSRSLYLAGQEVSVGILLNARRRHRLDHPGEPAAGRPDQVCSTPGGVIVSITVSRQPIPDRQELLNARRRHRLDHSAPTPDLSALSTAQRPEASSSRSRPLPGWRQRRPLLLNARRRHRLDHDRASWEPTLNDLCSTPGGVIVSITVGRHRPVPASARCSTPGGVIVSITSASDSASTATGLCSTPGGVIVSITWLQRPTSWSRTSAQRPEASSSRSRWGRCRDRSRLITAQRPEASSSRSPPSLPSNPRNRRTAQRPEASSSRSRVAPHSGDAPLPLLNARRRHRLDHRRGRRARRVISSAAQRPEASSSRSPLSPVPRAGNRLLLNARRRHRLDHAPQAPSPEVLDHLLNARRRHRLDHAWRR